MARCEVTSHDFAFAALMTFLGFVFVLYLTISHSNRSYASRMDHESRLAALEAQHAEGE